MHLAREEGEKSNFALPCDAVGTAEVRRAVRPPVSTKGVYVGVRPC